MKKLYALALGVCAALAANAQTTVTFAGGFNDWSATANPMTETSTGVYECDIENLINGFKVVVNDGTTESWLGSNDNLTLGTPMLVEAIVDGGNISFADGIERVTNAKVKFELASSMLTITGTVGSLEKGYAIHGNFATGEWASTDMTKGADGLYSITFTGLAPMTPTGEFGIKEIDAATGKQLAWIAAGVADVVISDEMEDMELTTENTKNILVNLTGDWTFIFDPAELLLTVTSAAGINDIAAEIAEGAAEYYNLQGVRVNEPAAGLYLVRKAGKVSKVVVK